MVFVGISFSMLDIYNHEYGISFVASKKHRSNIDFGSSNSGIRLGLFRLGSSMTSMTSMVPKSQPELIVVTMWLITMVWPDEDSLVTWEYSNGEVATRIKTCCICPLVFKQGNRKATIWTEKVIYK